MSAADETPWQAPATREPEPVASPGEELAAGEIEEGKYQPFKELGVTLLAPAAVYFSRVVIAPGVDMNLVSDLELPDKTLVIGALGLAPFLSAFVLVELAALVSPAWA